MSQAAVFAMLNRRTVRQDVNPYDKATIVSIFPKEVKVNNFTLTPGRYIIPPGSVEKPSLLVVGSASWWKEVDPKEPLLEIPQSSLVIAESIINDYCNGIWGCNMIDCKPGLFWVPLEKTIEQVKKEHSGLLEKAILAQKNYYQLMLRFADTNWAASGGSPLTINEEMRMAAKYLGQEDRDWMKDQLMMTQVRCFACGTMKDPRFPVCPACRAIDQTHSAAKGLKFAE